MMSNEDLHDLAEGVLTETLHGSVPLNTVGELATGVLRLGGQCAHQDTIFEELLVNTFALAELRDFWRKRFRSMLAKPVDKTTNR